MGTLRSKVLRRGVIVNGVTLGDPPITRIDGTPLENGDNLADDGWFIWNHEAFPTGVVYQSGHVDIDTEPEP